MDDSAVAKLTAELPGRYVARLPAQTINDLEIIASGGETPELLHLLTHALAKYHTPISPAEREELAAMLAACEMPTSLLDGITIGG